ncbi:MAG: hypothetical protein ACRC0G_07680 [Fusobacteriaceae bacterium]
MRLKSFNEVIQNFNEEFSKMHEDYSASVYNGAKYQDMSFIRAGSDDFFNQLSNTLATYSKGNNAIVQSNIKTVSNMLTYGNGMTLNKNRKVLESMKLNRNIEIPGYVYTIDALKYLDTGVLDDLYNFDKVLMQLTQYSSGEIIEQHYQFLVGYDRPAVMGKALGLHHPIGEEDFKTLLYTAFRNGETEPSLLEIDEPGLKFVVKDYFVKVKSDLEAIKSVWETIESACTRLKNSIDKHKSRIKTILDQASNTPENTDVAISFLDSVKKSSIAIDEILNVYARVMRSACNAMLDRIRQDQQILLQVLEGGAL